MIIQKNSLSELDMQNENFKKIVAAIISAIHGYEIDSSCSFKIKKIKKSPSMSPWNFAGINETINSRFF